MPCAFNSRRQDALVLSAASGYAPWQDFTPFRYEAPEPSGIFIINIIHFVGAKGAYALFSAPASFLNHFHPP